MSINTTPYSQQNHRCSRNLLERLHWILFCLIIQCLQSSCVSADNRVAVDRNVQDNSTSILGENSETATLQIGIEGYYRVGYWTGVRRSDREPITAIKTRDGDGVEVEFRQATTDLDTQWRYVIPGSEAAPLITDSPSQSRIATRFPAQSSPSRGPAMIPLSMPWIVVIGDTLGIDKLNANELLDRDASVAVSHPSSMDALPDSELGYSGVNLIVIGGSGSDLLGKLSLKQQNAIVNWVHTGGRVLFTLGASSSKLLQNSPWLEELIQLDEISIEKIDPSSLETFTSSQTPLEPFDGLVLPRDRGSILLMGRTTRRDSTPLAIEFNVGLGQVIAIGADLETKMFAEWPERMDLLTQVIGNILEPTQELSGQKNRSTAYNDIAGQLRATLDQFEIKKQYSFSFLSLIVIGFLAFIGPLDFLLINRLIGKPLLGWLSFPISAISVSLFLTYQSLPNQIASNSEDRGSLTARKADADSTINAATQQWNRLEVIDIDTTKGIGLSRSIHYLYSHESLRTDLNIAPSPLLSNLGSSINRQLTTPFGYPGPSFGGIQFGIEDSRLPIYTVQFDGEYKNSFIQQIPLASRSSRGIHSFLQFEPILTNQDSVIRRPGSELLQGKLTNPLNADLLNGMLIYRNWTYLLPTRFPAGSQIESLDTLRQKNFRWQLSRQKALESSSETERWNPANTSSLERIGEIILFHEASGGTRYTNLKHLPLASLDLSHVLSDDRCILFGHLQNAATDIEIDGDKTNGIQGNRETFIRVIIPVEDLSQNP